MLILIALAVWMLFRGLRNKKKSYIRAGTGLGILTFLFFWLMGFWGEMLWFESLGFSRRFWTFELTRYGFILSGLVLAYLIVYFMSFSLKKETRKIRTVGSIAGAFFGGIWGAAVWDNYLVFINRVDQGVTDPVFFKDVGFYLFTLPFLDSIYSILITLFIISLIVNLIGIFTVKNKTKKLRITLRETYKSEDKIKFNSLYLSAGLLMLVLAFMKYLDRYHLLFSDYGIVNGAGWTDVRIKLPAIIITVAVTIVAGLILIIPKTRPLPDRFRFSFIKNWNNKHISRIIVTYAYSFVFWLLALILVPWFFQLLRVEPNELRMEDKYLARNIRYTRDAFALNSIEEKEFPASELFTKKSFEENQNIFENIRLWDYRALDAVYKQFQEIRLYYEFSDVDVDRYHIDGKYRQMMISAREIELRNLPAQSKTFVNKRFKYTHGYGITLSDVSEFTENGLPDLLIRDIPPVSRHKSLEVSQPRIYYGELTREHVIVNSREKEFDYPKGEKNEYYRYAGEGGVVISNFWRKVLMGWKFDGTRLLFSGNPVKNSRILFHRHVRDRVNTIAPFLELEDDPYIVLVGGQLYWIVDAYTTSSYYPYSEHFNTADNARYKQGSSGKMMSGNTGWQFHGKNYVRNSVKAVINAFTGRVDLYVFDDKDPIINVWKKIIPEVFKDKDDMPDAIMRHVRYPADYLLIQGLVYAKYHMTEPTVFYNQEDLWVRATEKYYGSVQPVEPYYVMWEPPESNRQEYILMLPFTPKNRQVAIGWIAGMCDMENYGRFLAYKFPKEKRIIGPQQVETKIDQDRFLSGQLTLWDQRGSNVIRGNVLAIPVDNTIIYVEPIYLRAETAAYPELRLIVVMHNDRISYAENFEKAIKGLFQNIESMEPAAQETDRSLSLKKLIEQANNAFNDYIEYTGQKQYDDASNALKQLERSIKRLHERFKQEDINL